ncbi:MAG: DUF2911 domain-containing protein [Bacteroidota bacterium]
MKKTILALLIISSSAAFSQPVLKTPAPSPLQTVTQAFGLGDLKVEYSRPSMKGRVVFGELVPFTGIWRTGANQATKLTVADDIKLNGTALAAGTYAIYTMPSATEWTVMIYKDLTLGGNVADYKTENELMRFKIRPSTMNDKMETFTIAFNDVTSTSCKMDLMWENTRVSIPVTTDIDGKIVKNIETIMNADKRPYFAAASYYYDNGKDMNKALEWVNKAVADNPDAYYMSHVKAKIQMKMGDNKGALATATASLAKAKEQKDDHYTQLNEKLIADLSKK